MFSLELSAAANGVANTTDVDGYCTSSTELLVAATHVVVLCCSVQMQVAFPAELDVYDFCTPELQQQLQAPREAYKDYQDKLAQQKRTAKQLKTEDGPKPGPGAAEAEAAAGDGPAAASAGAGGSGADVEMHDAEPAAGGAGASSSSAAPIVGALTGTNGGCVSCLLNAQPLSISGKKRGRMHDTWRYQGAMKYLCARTR